MESIRSNTFITLIFLLITMTGLNAHSAPITTGKLSEAKTPWAFWALLESYGGMGYSYHGDKALIRYRHTWQTADFRRSQIDFQDSEKLTLIAEDMDALAKHYRSLKTAQLNKLSPIEKLALVSGKDLLELDYNIKSDMILFASDWWGNCNGVAHASLSTPEPQNTVNMQDTWGRSITFYPSDIKALAAFYYAFAKSHTVGDNEGKKPLNPADLDRLVQERILQDKGFYVDIAAGEEKWNEPVFAYERHLISEKTKTDGSRRQEVRLVLHVAFVNTSTSLLQPDFPTQSLVARKDPRYSRAVEARYILTLDSHSKVMSSEWDPRYPESRIDYMAIPSSDSFHTEALNEYLPSYPIIQELIQRSARK